MKKGENAANEVIAAEMRYQANAIMERALNECRELGVKVYFDDPPNYHDDSDPGKERARRKSRALTQADIDKFPSPDLKTVERALQHKNITVASTYIGKK